MKKIYLASILTICAGAAAIAGSHSMSGKAEAPAKVTPEDPSDITLRFGYEGEQAAVFVSFKAPEREKSYLGEGAPLTSNIDEIVLNRREKGEWTWETVTTFTDVAPGTILNYTDKNITEGLTYEYNPVAYIGEDSSSTYNYEEVYAGIRPAAPSITATSFKGSAPVEVSVTAPTSLEGGEPLETNLTSIEICRSIGYGDTTLVHTFFAPAKGETYEWTDDDYKNLTDGSEVTYEAYAKTGNFSSVAARVTVVLKRDVPSSPETVEVKSDDNGVTISWTAVTKGARDYWFDPSEVTYNVYRIAANGVETPLASELTECTYLDDLSDVTSRNSYYWKVTAENSEGEGYGTNSVSILVGPAPTLPLTETFNTPGTYNPAADNLWTSEAMNGGYNKFNIEREVLLWISGYYDTYIYGSGNEGNTDKNAGFAVLEGSSYTKTEATYTSVELTTGTDLTATLTFEYYVIPQSKSILYVHLINPEEKATEEDPFANATTLATLSMNGQELGWKEYKVENIDLSDLNTFQLCFHGLTDPDDGRNGIITPICIDNINMVSTKSENSGTASIDSGTVTTEYFSTTGAKVTNPSKGEILIKVETKANGTTVTSKVIF